MQHGLPPTGRKLSPPTGGGVDAVGPAVPPRYNRLAIVGFGLSLAAIFLLILGQILLQPMVDHLGPNPTFEEQQKKTMELFNDSDSAGRMISGTACVCLCFVCWLAGVIISAIAATRKDLPGRRLAIAGITCSILIPTLFCASLLLGL
jgi:hypothetical protein